MRLSSKWCMIIPALVLLLVGATMLSAGEGDKSGENEAMLSLTSPEFDYGEPIPVRFTCDGEDLSPRLVWENVPEGTESFALICDDPDAPKKTWIHWIIFNIPADQLELPEGMSREERLSDGTLNGSNSWPRIGYNGPCPPPGKPHRYFFRLYALDTMLDLKPGIKIKKLEKAMEKHIIASAEWMGTYSR